MGKFPTFDNRLVVTNMLFGLFFTLEYLQIDEDF